MERRLEFSLSELIKAAPPKKSQYREKIRTALRVYFEGTGRTVVDKKRGSSGTIKGEIDWISIYSDLSLNEDFRENVRDQNQWNQNLVKNYSKSPPEGAGKYHMSILYWMHLPRHLSEDTVELNRIGEKLAIDIFKMSAAEKIAQIRETRSAIQASRMGPSHFVAYKRGTDIAHDEDSQRPRLGATYARTLQYPDAYQKSRHELAVAKEALLTTSDQSTTLTAAIYGAGGYGKSLLAQELCDDGEVQAKFSGGIYWLQFGLINSNDESAGFVRLPEAIDRMLVGQYPKSQRTELVWDKSDTGICTFLDVLPEEPLLIVADDVWNAQQLSWVSALPEYVSVLVTTRVQSVARGATHQVLINRLTEAASCRLLTHGMGDISPGRLGRLRKLTMKFGGWPLLLGLANGVFKQMGGDAETRIDKALDEYEQFLSDDQIDGWDIEQPGDNERDKRRKLVGFCIEAGLRAIPSGNSPDLLRSLAVFVDDSDISFSVAIGLWSTVAGRTISGTKGRALLRHFSDFSFFSSFNDNAETFRLHDEILTYFRTKIGAAQLVSLHQKLLLSMQAQCSGGWETLPQEHKYGWTRILFHLEMAERTDEANDLRTSFHWLKAKLDAVGSSEMQRSFLPTPRRRDAQLVGLAINLSISILGVRPHALAHQLYGRLGHETDGRLQELAQAARSDNNFWPSPTKPHLSPLGMELLRFVGHSGRITGAAFDSSGRRIITISDDGTARLWEAGTGVEIGGPIEGNRGWITIALFDPSGRRVMTASDDGTARLWDADTGAPVGEPLKGHRCVAFDPRGRRAVTASDDGTAQLWDAETGTSIGEPLKGHRCVAFDPSGRSVVTASDDGTAMLWDVDAGEPIGKSLAGNGSGINSIAFDPSGRKVATASDHGIARIWDAETGEPFCGPLVGHGGSVRSIAFDSRGRRLVTASTDGTARLWDAETGAPIGNPLNGGGRNACRVAFDPKGRRVVTASTDGTTRLWDAGTGAPIRKLLRGQNRSVRGFVFDSGGSRIITVTGNGTVGLWDMETGAPVGQTLDGSSVAFDPTGRRFVTASENGTAQIFDAETAARLLTLPVESSSGISLAIFDPSGRKVLTASGDGTAQLWDVMPEGLGNSAPNDHWGRVRCVAFDPNGRRVATGSDTGTVQLWNADTGAPAGEPLEGHRGSVRNIAFDTSGRWLVSTSWDCTARLWDAETGASIGSPLEGHARGLTSAVFDQTGRRVVTASTDGTARVWDVQTGASIGKPMEGHDRWVTNANFDPNGRRVVTASIDGTARLWNAETGEPIGKPLDGHRGWVTIAAFDPTGHRVVTASDDGTAWLWETETKTPIGMRLEGHRGRGAIAAFDRSGRRLVTASHNGTAWLWDVETGAAIGEPLEGHQGRVSAAAFAPSGRNVVTTSADRTVRLWSVEASRALAVLDFDAEPVHVAWEYNRLVVGLRTGLLAFFQIELDSEQRESGYCSRLRNI